MASSTSKTYQKPALYILIASEGQLLMAVKKLLLQRPLTQVYVVNESFFNWLEFQKNPLWQKEADRIFWLKSNFDEENSFLDNKIFEFLAQFQDKLTVIGFNYSPPPEDWHRREIGRQWLSLAQNSQTFYSRFSLNFPQSQVILGQDVVLEEKISQVPFCAFWSFWSGSSWKIWSSGQYYWQTWEDFWQTIEPKILHPLSKMRFLVTGNKISGEKWLKKQAQLIEVLEKRTIELILPAGKNKTTVQTGVDFLENVWAGQLVKINSAKNQTDQDNLALKWLSLYKIGRKFKKPGCDLTDATAFTASKVKKPRNLTANSLFTGMSLTSDNNHQLFQNIDNINAPQLFNGPSFEFLPMKTNLSDKSQEIAQKSEIDPLEGLKTMKKTTVVVRNENNPNSQKSASRLLPEKKPALKTPSLSVSASQTTATQTPSPSASSPSASSPSKNNQKSKKQRLQKIIFAFSFFFLITGGILYSVWHFSLKTYLQAFVDLTNKCLLNSTTACDWDSQWSTWQQAKSSFVWQRNLYSLILSPATQNEFQQIDSFANQIISWQDNQKLLQRTRAEVFLGLTGRQSASLDPTQNWENLSQARVQQQELIAVFLNASEKLPSQSHFADNWSDQLTNQLKTLQSDANLLSQRESWWQDIFADSRFKPQYYALLTLNPLFARPTGGLMETVTLLEVNHGQLESITTYSAEEINSQLPTHFLPANSSFVGQLMGENKVNFWTLSQEMDFGKLAEKTASYIKEALGIEISGVFGLNADLWLDKADHELWMTSRFDLQDQSRATYWKTLVDNQLVKTISVSDEEFFSVMQNLTTGFEKRQLFAWLANEELQKNSQQLNRTGTLVVPNCQQLFNTSSCVSDSLVFMETLLGQKESEKSVFSQPENSLNYVLETKINLTPDKIEHTLNLVAKAEADNKSQYYWQFLFPQNAQIESVLLNGIQTSFNTENGLLVAFTDRQQQTLALTYTLPSAFNEKGWTYTYYQRYPTTANSWQNTVSVTNQTTLPYQVVSPSAEYQDQNLRFNWHDSNDLFISIGF